MKILLTNDDGFHADGIQELYKSLSERHEVFLVAPEKIVVDLAPLFLTQRKSRLIKSLKQNLSSKEHQQTAYILDFLV